MRSKKKYWSYGTCGKGSKAGNSFPTIWKFFTRTHALHLSRQIIHVGEWYSCHQCDDKTNEKSGLTTHEHTIHVWSRYCCNQCEYKATHQDCLTTHKRSKQEGVRYTCNKCEYTTYQKKNLTNHNHSKHDKVWYHCDECKYKATCMVIWTLTNSSPVLESLWTVIPVINVNKNAFLLCGLPNIWNVHGNMYGIIRTFSRHSTMWHVS